MLSRWSSSATCPPARRSSAGSSASAAAGSTWSSCRWRDALGRVTAAPIWALRSSPAFDASAMDGIAVRSGDTLGATETSPRSLPAHAVVDTGDPLPEGFDAVVMREHVHWEDGVPEVRSAAAPWQHVRTIGEDVSATELLLPEGHRLRAVDLAAAAAAGHVPRGGTAGAAGARDPHGRRDRAARERPGAGAAARHERPDAGGAGDRGGVRGLARARSCPTTRSGSRRGAGGGGARRTSS